MFTPFTMFTHEHMNTMNSKVKNVMIVSIADIKSNKTNPRNITPEKLEKLKQSISDFPDMLNKRPLVCFTDKDGKYVVLGGNMRLKACKDLGIKELPITLADEWTEEQKNEFIIKDNVGFGEWDWDVLSSDWAETQLEEWGLDLWKTDEDYNDKDNYPDLNKLDNYLNKETGVLRISFEQNQYKNVIDRMDKIMNKKDLKDHSEVLIFLLENYERN